jgi:hypothetical protein
MFNKFGQLASAVVSPYIYIYIIIRSHQLQLCDMKKSAHIYFLKIDMFQ